VEETYPGPANNPRPGGRLQEVLSFPGLEIIAGYGSYFYSLGPFIGEFLHREREEALGPERTGDPSSSEFRPTRIQIVNEIDRGRWLHVKNWWKVIIRA
jgi:hypothetical protein